MCSILFVITALITRGDAAFNDQIANLRGKAETQKRRQYTPRLCRHCQPWPQWAPRQCGSETRAQACIASRTPH
eukprot:2087593-Pleurochrysis_carterae.AAC.1